MTISTFEDLLRAARQQSQPQRLLLVFAGASLPAGAAAEQRARFDAGESGELAPLMCVDKDPQALASFPGSGRRGRHTRPGLGPGVYRRAVGHQRPAAQ